MTIRAFVRTALLVRRYKITQNLINEYKEISQYKNERKEKLLEQILPHLKNSLLSLLYELFTDLSSLKEISEIEQKEEIVAVHNFVGKQIKVLSEKNCDVKNILTPELLQKIQTETKIAVNIIQKNKEAIKKKKHTVVKKAAYAGVLAARAATMGVAPVSEAEVLQNMKPNSSQSIQESYDTKSRVTKILRETRREEVLNLTGKTLGELRTTRIKRLSKIGFSQKDIEELYNRIKDDIEAKIFSIDTEISGTVWDKYNNVEWVEASPERKKIFQEILRIKQKHNITAAEILGFLSFGLSTQFIDEFISTNWHITDGVQSFYELLWLQPEKDGTKVHHSKATQVPLYLFEENWNYFKQFMDVKDITGKKISFSNVDIVNMWLAGTDVRYLKNIASKHKLTNYELRVFSNLSASALTYVETDKPNALVVLPKTDYNGAFLSPATKSLVDVYGVKHDCKVIVTGKEQDIWDAVREFNPKSIIIAAHGLEGETIRLSRGEKEENIINKDDIKDIKKLKKRGYFNNLEHLFLISCSAAKLDKTGIIGMLQEVGINNITGSKTDFLLNEVVFDKITLADASYEEIQTLGNRVLHANSVEFVIRDKENTRTIRQ